MYIYFDSSNDVRLISEGLIISDFSYIQKDLTEQEKTDLANAQNKRQVIDEILVITKPSTAEYDDLINKINASSSVADNKIIFTTIVNKIFNK